MEPRDLLAVNPPRASMADLVFSREARKRKSTGRAPLFWIWGGACYPSGKGKNHFPLYDLLDSVRCDRFRARGGVGVGGE